MDQHFFGQDYHRSVEEEPLVRIIITRIFQHPKKFLIFLSVLVGGGLFFYFTAQQSSTPTILPLIKAPEGPSRIPPTTENTLLVPHQDRQVYKNIEKTPPSGEGPKVEHLLPPVEAPFLSFKDEEASVDVEAETGGDPVQKTQDTPPLPEPLPTAAKPSPLPAIEKKAGKASIDSIDQLLSQKPMLPKPEAQAQKGEKYRLQLGSLPTREAAEKEWARIQKAMKEKEPIFQRLKPRFERIDLGAEKGGIVYRIILGNIGSKEGAKRLESHLKERKISCLVIAP